MENNEDIMSGTGAEDSYFGNQEGSPLEQFLELTLPRQSLELTVLMDAQYRSLAGFRLAPRPQPTLDSVLEAVRMALTMENTQASPNDEASADESTEDMQ